MKQNPFRPCARMDVIYKGGSACEYNVKLAKHVANELKAQSFWTAQKHLLELYTTVECLTGVSDFSKNSLSVCWSFVCVVDSGDGKTL